MNLSERYCARPTIMVRRSLFRGGCGGRNKASSRRLLPHNSSSSSHFFQFLLVITVFIFVVVNDQKRSCGIPHVSAAAAAWIVPVNNVQRLGARSSSYCKTSAWTRNAQLNQQLQPKSLQKQQEITSVLSFLEDDRNATDHYFMQCALKEAQTAALLGEVPIGAVVVKQVPPPPTATATNRNYYQILSRAHNLVETNQDAIAHAEVMALRQAASTEKNWRLYNCTLYCTFEPCPVCCASAQAFRINRIVYGTRDKRLGAIETHMRLLDDYVHPYHNELSSDENHVTKGVLEEQCSDIVKAFFRERRRPKRERKRKQDFLDSAMITEPPEQQQQQQHQEEKQHQIEEEPPQQQSPTRRRWSFWKLWKRSTKDEGNV